MAPELGGSQISTLLETVPGIARVLRSPVADAMVNMIRAGASLTPFYRSDAEELLQYAVRRALINSEEAERILAEVRGIGRKKRPVKALKPVPPRPRMPLRRKSTSLVTSASKPTVKVASTRAASDKVSQKTKKPVKKTAKRVVKRR